MIPKKIHWCWLSGDPLPSNFEACVNSWKEIMPDYEIICWDKSRFDIHSVPFVEEAYNCKKYAFAADYIRLYALYTEGGIYLDSDVKVFERFDRFLHHSAFSSVEISPVMIKHRTDRDWHSRNAGYGIQGAIIGAEKGNEWIGKSLHFYDGKSFLDEEGKIAVPIICSIMAKVAEENYGFKIDKYSDDNQMLINHIGGGEIGTVYPSYVFAALYGDVRFDTVCIHLAEQTWGSQKRPSLCKKLYARLLAQSRFWGWLHYRRKTFFQKNL